MAANGKLRIDIVSDVMCPWCIIGYKQVSKALENFDEIDAEIWWHPFELNPDLPPEGKNATQHIMDRYGRTKEQSQQARQHIADAGKSVGFEFSYSDDSRMYNTFKAHKLLGIFGRERGAKDQTQLKLALFDAYFKQGRDVSNDDVLADIAEANGMDRIDALRWIADDALSLSVREEQAHWQDQNVTGVPAVIFDQKFMVPGAQSAETFANVIGKILAKRDPVSAPV